MVRILPFAIGLLAGAPTAQGAQFCQCLFIDGSHCCTYQDPEIGNLDCQSICTDAHRADGATTEDPLQVGTPCNASGKYETVSGWNAQFRRACYKQ